MRLFVIGLHTMQELYTAESLDLLMEKYIPSLC
jgi:hypothetical protein